ncbi:hypothetical protein LJC39_02570, partial [Parabacteroides sp. OttesenSCG-928-B22]|nr:hypothetical protein [Parabacteroides sp. OttesenSCG-928-B22]
PLKNPPPSLPLINGSSEEYLFTQEKIFHTVEGHFYRIFILNKYYSTLVCIRFLHYIYSVKAK